MYRQLKLTAKRALIAMDCHVPSSLRDDLLRLQYLRIGTLIPVLYLTIGVIAIVASAGTGGGFDPVYHIVLPASIIMLGVYRCLVWYRRKSEPVDLKRAARQLRSTTILALVVGLVGGLWTLDAYYSTLEIRRVVPPIFIFMVTFASAICLNSLPKAALGAMITALVPVTVAMILSPDPGIRAMGMSLLIVSLLMCGLVVHNFGQMVSGLKLQLELQRLSETDALTGLANRRAFAAEFDVLAENFNRNKPIAIMMIDLDGFKAANDAYGHAAGDDILVDVSSRLKTLCKSAACIARLGGDEFAILFATAGNLDHYVEHQSAIRKILALPYVCDDKQVFVTASIGMASSPDDGLTLSSLLRVADRALYAEKQESMSRKAG